MELKDGEGTSSEEEENSDSDESSSDEDRKPKGVSGLIEIENPNRVSKKPSAGELVFAWAGVSVFMFWLP